MENKIDKIYRTAENKGGLVRTSEVEALGIGRHNLSDLVGQGFLVRESQGIYTFPDDRPDEFFLIQARSNRLIYSYGTALFLHGLSDRVPSTIDVTVPQGYNASKLKNSNPNLKVHYVQPDFLLYETEEIITPQGYTVKVYTRERCICEMVKRPDSVEKQIYIQALRQYFKEIDSPRNLLKIAKAFGVEKRIREYLEVI